MYYYASKLTAASLNGSSIGGVNSEETIGGDTLCRCHEIQNLFGPQSSQHLQKPSYFHPSSCPQQFSSSPNINNPTSDTITSELIFAACNENTNQYHWHQARHKVRLKLKNWFTIHYRYLTLNVCICKIINNTQDIHIFSR